MYPTSKIMRVYALSSLIREAKTSQVASFIQSSSGEGMQRIDTALERLVAAGAIAARDALDKALDKESFAKFPAVARGLGPEAALTS
jgi:twitching motility protein PilT